MDAVVGEDVGLAIDLRLALGADADEREVGGAAADVGDEDLLLARHRLLVVERGGDRLVLEDDLAKAGARRRAAQRRLGLGVALGVVVDEVDRSADDGAIDRRARRRLGAPLQVAQVGRDDVEEANAAAAADVGRLLDERAAEDALHRSHQAAVDAVDVGGDRGAAELARRRRGAAAGVALAGIEHRRRHGAKARLELDQAHRRAVGNGDGGVRGAEVDGAVGRGGHGAGGRPAAAKGARF